MAAVTPFLFAPFLPGFASVPAALMAAAVMSVLTMRRLQSLPRESLDFAFAA